jgi:hypothetical protein
MNKNRMYLIASIVLAASAVLWLSQTPQSQQQPEGVIHEQVDPAMHSASTPTEGSGTLSMPMQQNLGSMPDDTQSATLSNMQYEDLRASRSPDSPASVKQKPTGLLTPTEAKGRVFPAIDNEQLVQKLREPQRIFWEFLRQEFPHVDVTEVQQYHGMLSDKRATFGPELTDETVDAYRQWISAADALHLAMIRLRAEEQGLSLGGMDEEGRGYALIGFEEGRPLYTFTSNVSAAVTTGANLVRWSTSFDPALGATVDGTGLYVNINDHGEIYEHTEFQLPSGGGSRIMIKEVPSYSDGNRNHMTHVAGTVTAWGYSSSLRGMAPRAWIRALIQQNTGHVSTYGMRYPGEMHGEINPRTGEQQQKSVIGNTSLGSTTSDGLYNHTSRSFDFVLRDFPYYVHFYAAANNGSNFETLAIGNQLAKNTMTIGAVNDVSRDTDGNYTSGGGIASFSSRGPAFDGRIKPDFTATGVSVTSPTGTSGSSTLQGTSMASPNAAGSTLLLIDYIKQRFPGHFARASTYKSLLMTTSDDRGNPGPDYTFGWGIVNVFKAGKIIRHHAENSYDRVLLEERLHPGQVWTYSYTNSGSGPIRASLAWIDVPGATQTTNDTTRTSALVNDLDMRIIGPDSAVYYPYVMPYVIGQGSTPAFSDTLRGSHATTGDNFTDPAEQILINNPAAGIYTVQISHKGSLDSGLPQPFSFSVTGLRSATAAPAIITAVTPAEGNNTDDFPMAVLGSGFVLGSDVLLRRHGTPVVQAYRVIPVGDRIDFRIDTAGIEKGYYDVVVRAPDGTESVLPNGFLMPITGSTGVEQSIYTNTFANANGLTLTGNWAVGVPNQSSIGGPGSAFAGTQVLGTYLNGNYENNINIYATLPPISTGNRDNIKLTFRRWLGLAYNQSGAVGSRHRDDGRIHYSLDGSTWTQVWESNAAFNESSWSQQTINLPSAVNNQSQVFIRFQLQADGANVSYGWNIDDLRVTGVSTTILPPLFTSQPLMTATQKAPYSYLVTTSDGDTLAANLILQATDLPPGLSFVNNGNGTALLSGSPTLAGNYAINISVSDGDYTTWQSFDLLVHPLPPISVSPQDLSITEGQTGPFHVSLPHAPDSNVTVSVQRVTGSTNIVVQSGASLVFTPANGTNAMAVTILAGLDANWTNDVATFRCIETSDRYADSAIVTVTELDIDTDPSLILPFSENFDDAGNASTVGPLDGQHGWKASPGAEVVAGLGRSGSKALHIAGGYAEHAFVNGTNIVAVSAWIKPVAGEDPGMPPEGVAALFWIDTNRFVRAFNSNTEVLLPIQVDTNTYNHVQAWVNYDNNTWRLDINGTTAFSNFGTYSANTAFTKIRIENHASDDTHIDDIQIDSSLPPGGGEKDLSTITVTGATNFTYNGMGQGPDTASTTGSGGAITYNYSGTGSTTYSTTTSKPVDTGTYQVVAMLAEDASYYGAISAPYAFTISKATVTVTPTSGQSKPLGTADPVLTYGHTGAVAGQTPGFSGALSRASGETAGTYAITQGSLALSDNGAFKASNYNLAFTAGVTFEIIASKQTSTISVTGPTNFTYTGSGQGPDTATVTGSTATVSFSYSSTGATSYGPSATKPLNAGTYQVVATVPEDELYHGAISEPYAFTIAKATPTVNAWPTASPITLGQALSDSDLTDGSGSVTGGFAFAAPDTVPVALGSYAADVLFLPEDGANHTTVSGIVNVVVGSAITMPYYEDFETLETGPLHGQGGWGAAGAVVQTNETLNSDQAVEIMQAEGYMQQTFGDDQTNVWTDLHVKPVFCPDDTGVFDPNASVQFFFNAQGHPVVYNGSAPLVITNRTVAAGNWVRVTIHTDHVAKKWSLYIDAAPVAENLDFSNQDSMGYTALKISGAGDTSTYVDNIQVEENAPFETLLVNLTITTGRPGVGLLTPPVGTYSHTRGEWVEASVAGSPAEQNGTRHTVTGWTRTDSTSTTGAGTNVTFQLNENTILHWDWETHHWIELRLQRE